jgi:hypothetical protein
LCLRFDEIKSQTQSPLKPELASTTYEKKA